VFTRFCVLMGTSFIDPRLRFTAALQIRFESELVKARTT
jgi:hypothetical protein